MFLTQYVQHRKSVLLCSEQTPSLKRRSRQREEYAICKTDRSSACASFLRLSEWQAATNTGSAPLAQQLKRSAERANALLHSGQASAPQVLVWKTDAVVGYLD